jgi:signal recognition particle receptor subunit beta
MRFQGAVIRERGVTFAVVIVKSNVIPDRQRARRVIEDFQPVFPRLPVVLMAQDMSGRPTYFGRQDIARFMATVPLSAVPWKEYSLPG